MAYNTNNPVGSTDPRDLYDNAGNLDKFANGADPFYPDRLGQQRLSLSGMQQDFQNAQEGRKAEFDQFLEDSAFIWIGDYGPGLTFTSRSQYTIRDGNAYRLATTTTIPYTTTGNWATEQSNFSLVSLDSVLRQDLAQDDGSSRVGYGDRTVQARLRDLVSVADFGPVGSSVADNSPVFQLANNSFPSGESGFVLVPVGTYYLASDVVPAGRAVTFLCAAGTEFIGPGKIRTNFVLYDESGAQYGISRHAFGSNFKGGGVLIGGGAMDEDGQGTYLANDGHANWLRVQTSVNFNPTEVVIYGAAGQGRAISVIGDGFVDRTGGTPFDAAWVARPFYFMRQTFIIDSFISANRLKLKNLDGSPVSFVSATEHAYHYVRTTGTGSCSVTGTTVKRITGQPFVPFITYPGYQFRINGAAVSVSAFVDGDEMTLTSAIGDVAQATYDFELDINAQISTLRVQKTFGHNEENLTISAKATGEYEIRGGGSGSGEDYPIRFYNGHTAPFTPRPVAIITPDGRFGVSNSQVFSPVALFEALDLRSEPLSAGVYNEACRISTVWNNTDIRSIELGSFATTSQGGYLQGRDYAGNTYDLALNPRGGNIGIGVNNPAMKLTVAGVVGPGADNLYSLGQSGARWSVVWAATGSINTSGRTTKTDIKDTKLGLDFINALRPVSYRFIVGGNESNEVEDGFDEVQRQVTETVIEKSERKVIEEVNGKKVLVTKIDESPVERPVYDVLDDLHDANGQLLPPMRMPRMEKVRLPRYKTVVTPRPGVRLHEGFIADEVLSAMEKAGVNFGAYVLGENGEEGLRHDELIGPMVRAIQQLSERLEALERK